MDSRKKEIEDKIDRLVFLTSSRNENREKREEESKVSLLSS